MRPRGHPDMHLRNSRLPIVFDLASNRVNIPRPAAPILLSRCLAVPLGKDRKHFACMNRIADARLGMVV